MTRATYDLRDKTATFEFFLWLVLVQAKGATEIWIDKSNPKTKKLPLNMTLERIENILVPGSALAGLPYRMGSKSSGVTGSAPELIEWCNSGRTFQRLKSVKPPVDVSYTVTLRRNPTDVGRDSNEPAWRQFAEEIGAVLIEDYSVKPIHLHDRMALYAGAKMNFGVCNGPMGLIGLSPYPVTIFISKESNRKSVEKSTIFKTHFPWFLENHRLIWENDTIENLRAVYRDG